MSDVDVKKHNEVARAIEALCGCRSCVGWNYETNEGPCVLYKLKRAVAAGESRGYERGKREGRDAGIVEALEVAERGLAQVAQDVATMRAAGVLAMRKHGKKGGSDGP